MFIVIIQHNGSTIMLLRMQALGDRRKGPCTMCIRCAPALIVATIDKLKSGQMSEVTRLGFGSLLEFNLEGLERRALLCFLMDRTSPVEMVISTGDRISIPVMPHAVKCVLGIPCDNSDAPIVT